MMWSRSAKNRETGLFTFECHDWNGNLFAFGSSADANEIEEMGQDAERRMTITMQAGPAMTLDEILAELSDLELLLELPA